MLPKISSAWPSGVSLLALTQLILGPSAWELNKVKVTNWYNLGLELYVEDAELETIRQNNPRDQDNCKREMFRKWLSTCPQASYRQLAQALVSVGDVSEADRLCKNHGEECMFDIAG